ncbi:MAG: hypothetical protein OXF33_09430 [Rhodospirillales bacterium]|nr:hypothetical protein [Rhodospirillales bacterium]
MKRTIKFDLPIDGVRVATLDELCDHFTTEILEHFHSGLLRKWLLSRELEEIVEKVDQLESEDDATTLRSLCQIFKIEADDDAIAAALGQVTSRGGVRLDDQASSRELWTWLQRSIVIMIMKHTELQDFISHPPRPDFSLSERQLKDRLTKNEWSRYLRIRIALCLTIVWFLRDSPSQLYFGKLVKYAKANIADYVSCYGLASEECERAVTTLISPESEKLGAIEASEFLERSLPIVRKADFVNSIAKLEDMKDVRIL